MGCGASSKPIQNEQLVTSPPDHRGLAAGAPLQGAAAAMGVKYAGAFLAVSFTADKFVPALAEVSKASRTISLYAMGARLAPLRACLAAFTGCPRVTARPVRPAAPTLRAAPVIPAAFSTLDVPTAALLAMRIALRAFLIEPGNLPLRIAIELFGL